MAIISQVTGEPAQLKIMPATSQSQQKLMGIVHAIQKGDMPASKAHGEARELAKKMDPQDVKDFASTKRKGLPKKADSFTGYDKLQMAWALM